MKNEISLQPVCKHPEDSRYIRVIRTNLNCETTVTACKRCGIDIDKPFTDC